MAAFSPSRSSAVVVLEPSDLDPTPTLADFKAVQQADPVCSFRLHALTNGSAVESDDGRGAFFAVGGALYHRDMTSSALQLAVPVVFQHTTVAARHNAPTSGHIGINKTIGALVLDFYRDTMRRDVERYVHACDTCQRQKATRHFRHGMQHNLTYITV